MKPEIIRAFFKKDHFVPYCGIKLISVSAGSAKATMKILSIHLNPLGIVHGGAIFTLADFCFAVAANSRGRVALSLSASINFIRPVTKGMLTAKAQEIGISNRVGTYLVNVTDDQGDCIAVFQGVAHRKQRALPK